MKIEGKCVLCTDWTALAVFVCSPLVRQKQKIPFHHTIEMKYLIHKLQAPVRAWMAQTNTQMNLFIQELFPAFQQSQCPQLAFPEGFTSNHLMENQTAEKENLLDTFIWFAAPKSKVHFASTFFNVIFGGALFANNLLVVVSLVLLL
jgi:hypothetical protein